jgi:hypothetical protein
MAHHPENLQDIRPQGLPAESFGISQAYETHGGTVPSVESSAPCLSPAQSFGISQAGETHGETVPSVEGQAPNAQDTQPGIIQDQIFRCDGSCEVTKCAMTFPTQAQRDAHTSKHCHLCYKNFFGMGRQGRKAHEKTHIPPAEERYIPVRCPHNCGTWFSRSEQLGPHLQHGLCPPLFDRFFDWEGYSSSQNPSGP